MSVLNYFRPVKIRLGLKILCFTITVFMIDHNIHAQCNYSPVIASQYFAAECGEHYSQNLFGAQIPVYGQHNGLYFSSPLTNNITTTATDEIKFNELIAYPNPTLDVVNILWAQPIDADILIYTGMGQLVSISQVSANTLSTIDVQHLLPGYYFIKAITSSNQTFITKLIKQ